MTRGANRYYNIDIEKITSQGGINMREQGAPTAISKQALQRMPYYIRFLREMEAEGLTVVAAPAVAAEIAVSDVAAVIWPSPFR